MAHLRGFGLENFRVFEKETWFDFAPITILTGTNSSGKSSLNKALLLLKENILLGFNSMELKFNEDAEHNLGSQDFVRYNKEYPFVFSFSVDNNHIYKFEFIKLEEEMNRNANLKSISVIEKKGKNDIIKFDFKYYQGQYIYKRLDSEEKIIENYEGSEVKTFINYKYLINQNKDKKYSKYNFNELLFSKKHFYDIILDEKNQHDLESLLELELEVLSNNTYKINQPFALKDLLSSIESRFTDFGIYYSDDVNGIVERGEHFDNTENELIDNIQRKLNVYGKHYEVFCTPPYKIKTPNFALFMKELFNNSFMSLFNTLNYSFSNIEYILNHRANPVRISNIFNQQKATYQSINSIINNNIEGDRLLFFNKWCNEFNLNPMVKDIEGAGYNLFNKGKDKELNFSDVGFGYLQLLPIIVKCSLKQTNLIIIEEPETNLHPALQSKLADMFVDATKTFRIQFIIETHSEYLIRRLQYLTAKKEIKPEDTIIHYLFNPESDHTKETGEQLRTIRIQQDGRLDKEFGTGFFDESTKLIEGIWNLASQN